MIKAIVFDYAGVIAEGVLVTWAKKNNIARDEFLEMAKKWDLGQVTLDEYYDLITGFTNVPKEKIWETIFEPGLLNTEVVEIIKKLKKNYKIALFSNNYDPPFRRRMEKDNITSLFDEIIISSVHKLLKPDPRFYELLIKKLGVSYHEVIFIDDSKENVDAALELGIKALLYKTPHLLIQELSQHGVNIQ